MSPDPRYVRLAGSRFLRYHRSSDAPDSITLTLFDLAGRRISRRSIPMVSSLDRIRLAQSDIDSAVVLAYGGSSGVRITVLDPETLQIIRSDTRVSATSDPVGKVAAAFCKDTLLVAWEDSRNGVADIYGNHLVISKQPFSGIDPDRATNPTHDIFPNPGKNSVVVRFVVWRESDIAISIVDIRGSALLIQRPGRLLTGMHQVEFGIEDLQPGIYIVLVRTGSETSAQRLVVR